MPGTIVTVGVPLSARKPLSKSGANNQAMRAATAASDMFFFLILFFFLPPVRSFVRHPVGIWPALFYPASYADLPGGLLPFTGAQGEVAMVRDCGPGELLVRGPVQGQVAGQTCSHNTKLGPSWFFVGICSLIITRSQSYKQKIVFSP